MDVGGKKKQRIKRNRRRKIMAGRFDHRHLMRVSKGLDEVNLKGENKRIDLEHRKT